MKSWILRSVVGIIKIADAEEIDYILDTVMNRKRELYPDWELFYCAAPKETVSSPEEMVRKAWEYERRLKEKYR